MSYWITVDIGGTKLRAACYQEGNIQPAAIRKIPAQHNRVSALQQVTDLINSLWPTHGQVAGIGVAAPGPVDPFSGTVLWAPSIREWVNYPLEQTLAETFQTQAYVGNDANLAALGEWKYGAGQGHQDMIYLTISTGIGGGVVANGQLLLGKQGLAGELGHTTVLSNGPLCSCGRSGHLEAVASGPSIARWTEAELQRGADSNLPQGANLTCRQIAKAAMEGDPLAQAAFERAGKYLGLAISNYVNIFNPSLVILGGGVAQSGDLLLAPIRAILATQVYSHHFLDSLQLTTAALGDDAGLLGALELAQTRARIRI